MPKYSQDSPFTPKSRGKFENKLIRYLDRIADLREHNNVQDHLEKFDDICRNSIEAIFGKDSGQETINDLKNNVGRYIINDKQLKDTVRLINQLTETFNIDLKNKFTLSEVPEPSDNEQLIKQSVKLLNDTLGSIRPLPAVSEPFDIKLFIEEFTELFIIFLATLEVSEPSHSAASLIGDSSVTEGDIVIEEDNIE